MIKDKHGFVWDPEQWKKDHAEAIEKGKLAREQHQVTEYQHAKYSWHLKQIMQKRFGTRTWMRNIVDPDTIKWDGEGNRVRPPSTRTMELTKVIPIKQKRTL